MSITKDDLAGAGIPMESWESIRGGADGRRSIGLEPGSVTIDVDRLAALGMREVRISFEPARAYDSCFCAEEITVSWTEVDR